LSRCAVPVSLDGDGSRDARRRRWATVGVGCLALSVGILGALRADHYDDAFITYVFARNLARGLGMVWFPGGPVFWGPTSMVYTLLLAAAGRLGFALPEASAVFGVISWALASAALVPLLWRAAPRAAIAAGLLSACSLIAVDLSPGMESGLFTAVAFAALAVQRSSMARSAVWAGCLAAVAMLVRPEGLLVFPLLLAGSWLAVKSDWRDRLYRAARPLLPGAALGAAALVSARLALGSFLPQAVEAKSQFGCDVSGCFSAAGLAGILGAHSNGPYAFFICGGALAGLVWALARRQPGRLLLLWAVAHFLGLFLGRAPDSPWYYAPLVPVLFAAVASLGTSRLGLAVVAVALAWTAGLAVQRIVADPFGEGLRWNEEKRRLADVVLAEIGARDPRAPRPKLLAFEVGYLGWSVDGEVIDVLGLVTPGFQPCLRGDDPDRVLAELRPDFVLAVDNPYYRPTGCLVKSATLRDEYDVLQSLPRPHDQQYVVWRRRAVAR
jgi:hypothetical protein